MVKIKLKKSNKIIIGIIPTINISEDDPYQDNLHVVSMYIDMILRNDAIPFMLPINNGHIDNNSLELCDGFLLPGSGKIRNIYYEVIDYAINNKKPLLGICAGLQALGIYSNIIDKTSNYNADFWKEYEVLKDNNNLLKKADNHFNIVTKDKSTYDLARHNINIKKDSYLYRAYGLNKNIISLHSFSLPSVGSIFDITAYSDDLVIEAIEYKHDNFIVGIQGHIEIEEDDNLFKEFIKYIKGQ